MDELQISGRRFISSRRIAKDNGYHTDYIGQLIRGGKIKGQKVGRTWYVDATSFDAYLSGEHAPANLTDQKSSGLLSSPQPGEAGQTFAQQDLPTPTPTPLPVVAEKKVEEKKEEEKVEIKKIPEPAAISARYVPVASGGLRFVADDEPLLPEISAKEAVTSVMPTPVVAHEPVARDRRPSSARIMFGLATVGIAVFIFSAVVSSTVLQTIEVRQGNAASVGYALPW